MNMDAMSLEQQMNMEMISVDMIYMVMIDMALTKMVFID